MTDPAPPTSLSAEAIASILGRPLPLPCGRVVPNRLMKSAMSEALGDSALAPRPELEVLYRTWSRGGAGLLVTGNVMVDRRALGEPGNVCVEGPEHLDRLAAWAEAAHEGGALCFVQLNHPGRQVPRKLNAEAVAPSAVPFSERMQRYMAEARALEEHEIIDIIERFARAAAVCAEAGFDGVQVHGAHGYLVSQFLSPLTNRRTDRWGGNPEKRRRFVLEVLAAIQAAVPAGFGVAIKLNSADFQRGGITEDEAMGTVQAIADRGVDFVEVSGGTYEAPAMMSPRQSTREREAWFLAFAEAVRGQVEVPLAVTGGFRSGRAMAAAIDSGAIDLVGLARPLVLYPDLPARLLREGDVAVELPTVKTGIKAVDRLGMTELLWYEQQIHRMGRGKPPLPREHALKSLAAYALERGIGAMMPRRGR